jgi:putative flippase GtrA
VDAFLLRLLTRLPRPIGRFLLARIGVMTQFLRFAVVGGVGFIVDTACVYALRGEFGLYGAGLIAWAVAVTANWLMNRLWTFRGQGGGPAHRQFLRYVAVNLVGFVLNRGAYALMVTFVAAAAAEPVLATAAGAVAGMFANYFLSRAMVFR